MARWVLGLLLLVPLMGFADKKKPEIWTGSIIEKPVKGSIVVKGQNIKLRNRATPNAVTMRSTSNDNTKYDFWVELPRQHGTDFQYLKIENEWFSSDGTGSDSRGTQTSFRFDAPTAKRVAAAFDIPVYDRVKLDDGMTYSWTFPAKVSLDKTKPIPVVLRADNKGKTTVGFMIGGRQRGPRDNRFVFTISRNGKPIAIKDAPDFGGIGGYRPIKPGEHIDVTCDDLRAWADLDLPGYYTIEAKYEGELSKDGNMPQTAAEQANVWDISAAGQGSILVQ